MTATPGSDSETSISLAASQPPAASPERVTWRHPAFRVTGKWECREPLVVRRLHDSDDGTIDWTLHASSAPAQVDLAGTIYVGHGYVECLQMTLPPWKLPLHELRWGRASFDGAGIVWIDWMGPSPRRWVFENGCEVEASSVGDGRIVWAKGEASRVLELDPQAVLRDGALGPSVLAKVPGLTRLTPAAFVASRETKWLSRAQLRCDARVTNGWSIHERVTFAGMVSP